MQEVKERIDIDLDSIARALSAPLTAGEIEWFIKSNPKDEKDPWAVTVPYVSNQGVIDRLNSVAGLNWAVRYGKPCVNGVEKVIDVECFITVYGITRSHVGTEPLAKGENALKGAYSDAIRNCGRLWGIGSELKSFPRVMCKARQGGGNWWIVDEAHEELELVCNAIIAKQAIPSGLKCVKVFGYKHGFAKGSKTPPKPAAPPAEEQPAPNTSPVVDLEKQKIIEFIDKVRIIYTEITGNEIDVDEKWKDAAIDKLREIKTRMDQIVSDELIASIHEQWNLQDECGIEIPEEEKAQLTENAKIKDLYKLFKANLARLDKINPLPGFKYTGVKEAIDAGDRCTPSQINEMFKLSYEANIQSPGIHIESVFKIPTQKIHTQAMAAYINYLKSQVARKAS